MDLRSSQPFWTVRDGLLRAYPALDRNASCDVIVLDKREIGWGSTSASTALLQYEIDVLLCELIEMRGERDAVLAYRACYEAIDKLAALAGRMNALISLPLIVDLARKIIGKQPRPHLRDSGCKTGCHVTR